MRPPSIFSAAASLFLAAVGAAALTSSPNNYAVMPKASLTPSRHAPAEELKADASDGAAAIDLAFVVAKPAAAGDSSSSPPVLFIHGLDSSSRTWRHVQLAMASGDDGDGDENENEDEDEEGEGRGANDDSTPSDGRSPRKRHRVRRRPPISSVACDCRGCGRSPLGDPATFSADAVAADVHRLVHSHELLLGSAGGGAEEETKTKTKKKVILVGHSMGGRVALHYAHKYPEDVAALVIEDMDARRRPLSSNYLPLPPGVGEETALGFERYFGEGTTADDVVARFRGAGYPEDTARRWLDQGRIRPLSAYSGGAAPLGGRADDGGDGATAGGGFWSEVNPAFRHLCYRHFFDNGLGESAWSAIALDSIPAYQFPVLVQVSSDENTVCDVDHVRDMIHVMETGAGAGGGRDVRRREVGWKRHTNAGHSIHGTAKDDFLEDLWGVIESVTRF